MVIHNLRVPTQQAQMLCFLFLSFFLVVLDFASLPPTLLLISSSPQGQETPRVYLTCRLPFLSGFGVIGLDRVPPFRRQSSKTAQLIRT